MKKFTIYVMLMAGFFCSSFADNARIDLSQIDDAIRSGEFQESIEKLSLAIEQQKKNLASFHQRRAECYFQLSEYDKAIQDYKEVLDYSVNGRVEFTIGKCLHKQRKYHDALAMFEVANSKLGSSSKESRHVKYLYSCYTTLALYGTGEFDNAIERLKRLRKEYPEEDMTDIFRRIELGEELRGVGVSP